MSLRRFLSAVVLPVAFIAGLAITTRSVRADDLPVIHVSGFISGSQTWSADNVYMIDSQV